MNELDCLRDQLSEVDRQLFSLISRRQRLALEIGRRKSRAGLPTRDFGQEKIVVERAVRFAQENELGDRLAETIALLLIEASLTAQERSQVVKSASGSGKTVLVIGGAGRMGGWMVQFLASQGYEVEVADPHQPAGGYKHFLDWRDTSLDHDIVVVAAPLRASGEILTQLGERPPSGLVFDIGSLKTPLRSPLLRLAAAGTMVTSVHPMFGPDTELLSGRHVIFVDLGVPEATQKARTLFQSTMAIQVEMDLDLHDKVIAFVLGLSHALNIAFFTALAESGEAVPDLIELSSTTFDAQLEVARKVAEENPALYFEIQSLNDYGHAALDTLASAVDRIRRAVREGDESSFAELMKTGRTYLQRRDRG
ncbi:MAG: bifunctional chorismate mutase/prephenate dehydrogenase [Gemmatimonadota bacterium]|nr:MAG: bifunctional chorismate mutase/prephenate dehydrogenase [Gemmatimonadota bacterium]